MSISYALLKLYPYIAFSLAIVCVDLSITAKRRESKKGFILGLFFLIFFVASGAYWFFARGDRFADEWYRQSIPQVLLNKSS